MFFSMLRGREHRSNYFIFPWENVLGKVLPITYHFQPIHNLFNPLIYLLYPGTKEDIQVVYSCLYASLLNSVFQAP